MEFVDAYKNKMREGTLKYLYLYGKDFKGFDGTELIDYLITYPNNIKHLYFASFCLSAESCAKIAHYVSTSSTVTLVNISYTNCGLESYLVVANALCTNSSVKDMWMVKNDVVQMSEIVPSFINALRLNPIHPRYSCWHLFKDKNSFKQFKQQAKQSTPPSMLEFLLHAHKDLEFKPSIRYFPDHAPQGQS